jgi:hypothetical protein
MPNVRVGSRKRAARVERLSFNTVQLRYSVPAISRIVVWTNFHVAEPHAFRPRKRYAVREKESGSVSPNATFCPLTAIDDTFRVAG